MGLTAICAPAHAQILRIAAGDLDRLSLEELGQIEVTSVSKRPEPVNRAPAAVYVITNDDIRRSGAMSLPEALRLAPNLEVARIDALDYSITARGLGGFEAANKLLVLIDGRSVYTPLYGGVDWDQQQVLLDDVDRIEVVSGPGGTLWGANAVNGVVSVTSRNSKDTQGLLASGAAGTLDSDVRLRYGGRFGANGAYRIYATGFQRGDLDQADGSSAEDGWKGAQAGFRTDWNGARDGLTLQGDIHDSSIDESLGGGAGYVRGANLLGRWERQLGGDSSLQVQAYYDRVRREARLVFDSLDTYDLQVQHTFGLGSRHKVVWGAGQRLTRDAFHTLIGAQLLDPPERTITITNVFAQDEIALADDLSLTLGLKAEDNSYTRLEFMPEARLAWRPREGQLLWAAASRAIRNPSRVERDFSIPGIVSPGMFDVEELTAYEAGYRGQPTAKSSISLSIFYDDYDDLRTNNLKPPGVFPGAVSNTMTGRVIGAEMWGAYDLRDWWRISAGFTALGKRFKQQPGSFDVSNFEAAGVDPDAWSSLRSQMKLSRDVDLDLSLRYVDSVPTSAAAGYVGAEAYAEADMRLAWRLKPGLELALSGLNLLQSRHAEASEDRRNQIPRSGSITLRWTR